MPRAARIHAPGHVFHIISRCMNREFLIEGPDPFPAEPTPLGGRGSCLKS